MRKPRLNAHLSGLPHTVPFVGPEALERRRGKLFRARLGANESAFGPSPRAVAAMEQAAAGNWKYADPENWELRDAIAQFHGVRVENVVVGEGIDGLLGHAVKLALEPGSVVVTSNGAYPTFNFHVDAHAGRLVRVPYRDDREDLGALHAAAMREDARIVYVSNPDNPMGSWWDAAALTDFIANLPDGTLFLLDEAYCDTAPAGSVPPVDVSNPQVLRFRTFSKAYGLAGARIGYCLGEASLIAGFEKVRNHYGINRVGQLGALEALKDQDYLRDAVSRIARARDRITGIARGSGLEPLPSATNFVAIDCGDAAFAQRLLDEVLRRDVFIRKPAVAPLDRCIRVSCGLDADLDLLAEVLPEAVKSARG
jgi:histidinol-phosphate aminotransferase